LKNVSVVMISMNEERAVGAVIDDIKKNVPGAEILIVDSSKDRTAEIATEKGAKVIKQFPPKGYGNAMMLALKSASGNVIVTMDCDGTYPADHIARLVELIESGYDVVDGCRLFSKPKNMKLINYFGNLFVSSIACFLFLRIIPDLHSGMRAYSKKVIGSIEFDPKGAALPVELLLKPIKLGYKVKLVPIPYYMRIGESTMNPYETIKMSILRIIRSRFCKR
jgi:glycosyltransferase involved in cell wall biosynthesis